MLAAEGIIDDTGLQELQEVVNYIWCKKYRYGSDGSLDDTKCRVARTAASAEEALEVWEEKFRWLLEFFLPGGRVMNALGTARSKCTAMNCFVSPVIEDSMEGIFSVLHKAALTMQAGGGIGFDFSTLRPKDAPVSGVGSTSSGPISFMQVYDAMCKTISSSGHRRGAMMAAMRVDHPDIEKFITAKRGSENNALENFNLSVLITDGFMEAVKNNGEWRLVFEGKVYKTVAARALWDQILAHAYDYAEPGVLFIDRINRLNNLYYCEEITATNPCGEQPLPPNGACNLGSINLTRFVRSPFQNPAFDHDLFHKTIKTAVRFLDNVIDVARLPLKEQRNEVVSKRRVGLGITGLADMLWMMGIQYGSAEALAFCDSLARSMRDTAYRTSVELAKEKGCFPLFDQEKYLAGEFVKNLPADIRNDMQKYGIRNSHLLSIAPTGTTSLLWGNISSGIEPIFDLEVKREIKDNEEMKTVRIKDYAYYVWRKITGDDKAPGVLTAPKINANQHIEMQAVWQKYFDASISKTINFDPNTSFEQFRDTYLRAYEQGLKGCTVYRDSGKIKSVIRKSKENTYVQPIKLPASRNMYAEEVDTPEGKMYISVTVHENTPREVFAITPADSKTSEFLEAVTRLMSIGLRCNVDPNLVLKQIKESLLKYGNVSSMLAYLERAVRKAVARIGIETTLTDFNSCPQCGGVLVMAEGCIKCSSCEYNKCS